MAEARPDSLTRSRAAKPAGEGAAFSPLYRQIKELLVQSLDRGEWKPGELIPSEIDLAARFQVSQGTVRKAVDELAAEHLLLRRQGKGTFVATHHEARVRYRFLRLAPALALFVGRQLSMNHMPTVIDDLWLPGTHFRGLTLELLTASKAPLYGLFESEFGVSMVRADEKLRAVAASPEIAPLLGVEPGRPLLQVDRISYTYGDRPMEVRRGLYLTDHYHYRNSLN
ncbi:GntR family transcriptional regulator [Bordetella pertussis]